jgi:hypothetical protein
VSARRLFDDEKLREPALRPDGRPYAEGLTVRADEVRVGDACSEVGTVMRVHFRAVGGRVTVTIAGRLLSRDWPANHLVRVVRRNWEPTKESTA